MFDNDTCRTCERWLKIIKDIKTEINQMNCAAYMGKYNVGLSDALKVIDKHIGRVKKG